jgi:hypothetical protein
MSQTMVEQSARIVMVTIHAQIKFELACISPFNAMTFAKHNTTKLIESFLNGSQVVIHTIHRHIAVHFHPLNEFIIHISRNSYSILILILKMIHECRRLESFIQPMAHQINQVADIWMEFQQMTTATTS